MKRLGGAELSRAVVEKVRSVMETCLAPSALQSPFLGVCPAPILGKFFGKGNNIECRCSLLDFSLGGVTVILMTTVMSFFFC